MSCQRPYPCRLHESWILIWNVPLPGHVPDTHPALAQWPYGGLGGDNRKWAGAGRGGDGSGNWAVRYIGKALQIFSDGAYLDVAQILSRDTKAEMAASRDTSTSLVRAGSGGLGRRSRKWSPWMAGKPSKRVSLCRNSSALDPTAESRIEDSLSSGRGVRRRTEMGAELSIYQPFGDGAAPAGWAGMDAG